MESIFLERVVVKYIFFRNIKRISLLYLSTVYKDVRVLHINVAGSSC